MKLTPKQLEVASALSQGRTQEEAARDTAVTRRTVARWWADPDFRAYVNELASEGVERAFMLIRGNLERVASKVLAIADGGEAIDPRTQLQAATYLLDLYAERNGDAAPSGPAEQHQHLHLYGVVEAERRYIESLQGQPAALGGEEREGGGAGAGALALRALSLPGTPANGQKPSANGAQVSANGSVEHGSD